MAIILVLSAAPLSGLAGLDFSGFFAVTAEAADDNSCGENLTWSLSDDDTLTLRDTLNKSDIIYKRYIVLVLTR